MKRYWLVFSQTVTVLLAVYFVVATLQPGWLGRPGGHTGAGAAGAPLTLLQAPQPTGADADSGAGAAQGSFSAAARQAMPAVVSITTSTQVRHPRSQDPWFQFFFGDVGPQQRTGLGSGVIMSAQGYILTNNHVVQGADEIEVALTDGRRAQARVIGTDPDTDLAVLKIALDNLPVIVLGRTAEMAVGDRVLAIGNPFGVGQTVTSGIISALGRNQLGINTFENFIQTDAAINPGNSGGALVDVHGHLLGINTAIYSRSGGSMGIGFAIPASTAQMVLQAIVREGRVTRGWIGVEPMDLTAAIAQTFGVPVQQGVLIAGVLHNAPAAQAGVRPGDVVVQVNGQDVASVAALLSSIAALVPGEPAIITVQRGSQRLQLPLTPATRPATRQRTR